jgi:hypothetical protein
MAPRTPTVTKEPQPRSSPPRKPSTPRQKAFRSRADCWTAAGRLADWSAGEADADAPTPARAMPAMLSAPTVAAAVRVSRDCQLRLELVKPRRVVVIAFMSCLQNPPLRE